MSERRRHGDLRGDGFVFWGYKKRRGQIEEGWLSANAFARAKTRSRNYGVAYHARPEVKARDMEQQKTPLRKQKTNAYWRKRRATDLNANLAHNVRKLTEGVALKSWKDGKGVALVGLPFLGFRAHLEGLFLDGMKWSNYGEWEIDHVKPVSAFDLTDPKQLAECMHYTNCRPRWRAENRRDNHKKRTLFQPPEPFTERNI